MPDSDLEKRVQRLEHALVAALASQFYAEAKLMALQERIGHLLNQSPLAEADVDYIAEQLQPRALYHFLRLVEGLEKSQPEVAAELRRRALG